MRQSTKTRRVPPTGTVRSYIRVSTDEQAKSGLSLDEQDHRLTADAKHVAAKHNLRIGSIYRDEGVSASRYELRTRKAGKQLDADLQAGDHVLIAKLDRAFRSQRDCINTVEAWTARGIAVHMLDLGVDTSTDVGKMIMGILAAVAQFDAARIGERIRDARNAMRRMKRTLNGSAPCGFRILRRLLVPHDAERKAAAKIKFLREKKRYYWGHIAETLNKEGRRYRGKRYNHQCCWRLYWAIRDGLFQAK